MERKLPEQHAFTYDDHNVLTRRRSATAEDLQARRQAAPPHVRTTDSPPASTHRAGHYAGIHPEDAPYQSQEFRQTRKQPVPVAEEEEDYPDDPPRRRTSAIAWQSPKATRVLPRRRFPFRWLFLAWVALCVMMIGWFVLSALSSWWMVQQDDWRYGRPRTYQCDAIVGHGDSQQHLSHFIAMNLNRQVLVIELPGGDPARALVYLGPTLLGDGQDLIPVTLSFQDMNGDGKPDMVIHIGDQEIVFLNNGTKFVSPH